MKIILFIIIPILGLLGLPFIIQKIFFFATRFTGTTIGSILSGFFTSLLLFGTLIYFTNSHIPIIEVALITLSLITNYAFFSKKDTLQYIDKVFLEGGLIGHIIFSVFYSIKYSPSLWF